MSDTQTIRTAGVEWTIGAPGTEQRITMRWAGEEWPIYAVKAESRKGTFWLFNYQVHDWNPRRRPFDRNWHLALDSRGRVVARAPQQDFLLWSLATGRDWTEADVSTTATLVDEPAQPQRQQPQQSQKQMPGVTREAPRQGAQQRGNAAKVLDWIRRQG